MAYWGVAMSIYHALWFAPEENDLKKGSSILKIAESIPASERERDYLNAIGAYYKDWEKVDHKTRASTYEKMMEKIYNKYEEDTEAAIFYALALNSIADPTDGNYTNQRKAGSILESILPNQPNHPGIAHYIIHNYDNPVLAPQALPTARKYAQIAPSSAHAQHMPSHIFTRLGLWDESIQSNLSSSSAAVCYAEAMELKGHWFEEIHSMDYLVYAYLQRGDNAKAMEQYQHLKSINKVELSNAFAIAYPFAAIPARLALENKQWDKASNLEVHDSELSWEMFPWQKSILHFARALGAAHTKDYVAFEKELGVLKTLRKELLDKGDSYKANQVMIEIKASQAWQHFTKGNQEEALALMQEAADMEDNTTKHPVTPGEVLPARELLGDLLLAMNNPSEALEAYKEDLKAHPNRFNGIYGAAIAAKESGNQEKAKMYFEQLLLLTKNTESDRPELEEANKYLSQI